MSFLGSVKDFVSDHPFMVAGLLTGHNSLGAAGELIQALNKGEKTATASPETETMSGRTSVRSVQAVSRTSDISESRQGRFLGKPAA